MVKDIFVRIILLVAVWSISYYFEFEKGFLILFAFLILFLYDLNLFIQNKKFRDRNKEDLYGFEVKNWMLNALPMAFAFYYLFKTDSYIYLLLIILLVISAYLMLLLIVKRFEYYLVDEQGIREIKSNRFWTKESITDINIEEKKVVISTNKYVDEIILSINRLKYGDKSKLLNLISNLNKLKKSL